MRVQIFNVAHGFCAYVVADNKNVVLIDAGYNMGSPEFVPSVQLTNSGCTGIETFVVTNYDEDHMADLPDLRRLFPIGRLLRNDSVNSSQLRSLKEKPLSPSMTELLEMIDTYTNTSGPPIDYAGMSRTTFHNNYPSFTDTNNLSLVMFLHYRNLHVAFTGDLETAGWFELLKSKTFQQQLGTVNIFVASHHGRKNGYCPEVFDHCKPSVVVISDSVHKDTSMLEIYAAHAAGVKFGSTTKKVLSTWDCGTITLSQTAEGGPTIKIGD